MKELICYYCQKQFVRRKPNSKSRRYFCSKTCQYKQKKIDQSDEFTPFRYMYNKARWECSKIGREFSISLKDIYNQWCEQGCVCNLSGINLVFSNSSYEQKHGVTTASIDRIDSSGGYTIDNIQIIHKDINMKLKKALNENVLIDWCRKISWHTRNRTWMDTENASEPLTDVESSGINWTESNPTPF